MTKYIYGAGGQKARANRVPRWRDSSGHGNDLVQADPRKMPTLVNGWLPRWYEARGIFWWSLAAALAALVAL